MTSTHRIAALTAAAVLTTGGLAAATTTPALAASVAYTHDATTYVGSTFDTAYGGQIQILDATALAPRAANPFPSASSQVNGLAGKVTQVVLTINGFDHEGPHDADIMLVAPTGERTIVMSDVGGFDAVSDVNLVFNDSSPTFLTFDNKLTSGTYHPSNDSDGDFFPGPAPSAAGVGSAMSAFNGIDPNGSWHLYVVDDLMTYTGGIDSWSVSIWTTGGDYPSTLGVTGAPGKVTDLDVELEVDHNRLDDIDMLLVGPQGQQATLLSDAGGPNEVDAATFVLDDEAAAGVPDPALSGTYRPTDVVEPGKPDDYDGPVSNGNTALSVFDGTDPNGTWKLYVVDDTANYRGYIAHWTLRITTDTAVPQPTTPQPTDPTGPQPTADTSHPRVESVRPGVKATGVRRSADVAATVTERLAPGSVKPATVYLTRVGSTRQVPAQVTWKAGALRIVLDPKGRLRAATSYRVVVTTRVTDVAGNRLDQSRTRAGLQRMTWRFTTA